ncbi:MAG TPA: hypothetical protein VGE26_09200 [Sphingobacteriaceae bacterium]
MDFKSKVTLYTDLIDAYQPFDAVEVHPVARITDNEFEPCEESEADLFAVYIHLPEEGLQCIADCDTRETAEALKDLLDITGRMFVVENED